MSKPENVQRTTAQPENSTPQTAVGTRTQNPPAFQLKANPLQRKDPETAPSTVDTTKYTVSDKQAIIRDDKFQKVAGNKTIPQWTEVVIEKTAMNGKTEYAYVKSPDGKTVYGWTAKSNLYSLSWNPKDHEAEYKKVSSAYNDQMQAVDPTKTRADLRKSGTGVKDIADKYYPNSTDPNKLDSGFKAKLDKMITGFAAQGITANANAGLRHPLRSIIFHYAIEVAKAGSESIIHEANAICTKYGIPIDWAHTNGDGTIDLKTSKAKAKEVKAEFGLGKNAAAGVKDFGGTISNHNNGKAVDLSLSFSFSKTKTIKVGDKSYSVNPAIQGQETISDIANDGLTLFGRDQYGLKRAIDTDPVHWSVSGR